ncbi:MAG: alginate export family protein [Tunicatimonas sp.]
MSFTPTTTRSRIFSYSICALALAAPTLLQAQFTLSGELRPRTEYRHGFKRPVADPGEHALFTEQRTRLNFDYQQEQVGFKLTLQDVRIWGETGQINKSDGLSSIHEAWGSIGFTRRLSFKVGRQELVYDDHRVLGNLDWAAQGRSHDAAKLVFKDSTAAIHLGVALNQSSTVPEPAKLGSTFYQTPGGFADLGGGLPNYKNLQFVWTEKKWDRFTITALGLNAGWQMPDTTVNYLHTWGINPKYQFNRSWRVQGSGYYQHGKNRANQPVKAHLASLVVTYQRPNTRWTLGIGGDWVSGTAPGQTTSTTFDPLFGTHHKFYGLMDYFYVGSPHSQQGESVGLVDLFVKPTVNVTSKLTIASQIHTFFSEVAVMNSNDPTTLLPARLGTELDVVTTYRYGKGITFKGGYSQMLATSSMEALKGGDHTLVNHWGWIMISFKPFFLPAQSAK